MSLFTHPGSILGDRICRGPRYLIPLLPFLMLALGTVAHRIPFWLLGITGSVSILINWTGTQYIVPQNACGALPMFFLGGPIYTDVSVPAILFYQIYPVGNRNIASGRMDNHRSHYTGCLVFH